MTQRPASCEERDAGVPRQLVVHVPADAQRAGRPAAAPGGRSRARSRSHGRRVVRARRARAAARRPRSRGRPRPAGPARRSTTSAKAANRSSSRRRRGHQCRPPRPRRSAPSVSTAPWVRQVVDDRLARRGTRCGCFARRYHEERCQNRLAAASASPWVASRPSVVACQGARGGVLREVGLEVGCG